MYIYIYILIYLPKNVLRQYDAICSVFRPKYQTCHQQPTAWRVTVLLLFRTCVCTNHHVSFTGNVFLGSICSICRDIFKASLQKGHNITMMVKNRPFATFFATFLTLKKWDETRMKPTNLQDWAHPLGGEGIHNFRPGSVSTLPCKIVWIFSFSSAFRMKARLNFWYSFLGLIRTIR